MTQTPKVEKKSLKIIYTEKYKSTEDTALYMLEGKLQTEGSLVNSEYVSALETALKAADDIIQSFGPFERAKGIERIQAEWKDALAKVDL